MKQDNIQELIKNSQNKPWQTVLEQVAKQFSNPIFSTSFGLEDQLITHYIATLKLPIKIFTLDTKRLPDETHQVWQKTLKTYGINITPYSPDEKEVEEFVKAFGLNGFYESTKIRHNCCEIRKVKPLKKALQNQDIWISGVTKTQSSFRSEKMAYEYDDNFKLIKYYPLLDINQEEILQEIKDNNIPYNALHDKGYPSIGCEPCTRAIKEGEDIRAGRWWWENDDKKECGLHIDKKVSK